MKDIILSVENVSKFYAGYDSVSRRFASWFSKKVAPNSVHWALKDINFFLKRGESLALVGKNGAGKSTLLKIITGTTSPSTGQVLKSGRVSAILELGLGFNPEFTGRENIYQAGGLLGYSSDQLKDLEGEIIEFASIGEYIDEPVRVYSSGMQARLAFAIATAVRPDILIVDEVLSVGDAFFQAKCFERIASFRREGTSLLFVTHSMSDVVKHCNRAILIDNGGVALDADPKSVCNLYLDLLFSEKKALPASNVVVDSFRKVASEDVFHTRPGYRKEEHRWGEGGAKILDYKIESSGDIYPAVIQSKSTVKFSFLVCFDKTYESVVAGFLIKTHDGIFLYGTNSILSQNKSHRIDVLLGEVYEFSFEMPAMLNEGHYLLSFGISYGPEEKLIPIDRRYDAVIVTIAREKTFWGMVDLDSNFYATKIENG